MNQLKSDVETLEKSIRQEKKDRETSWEGKIDDLGQIIMGFEEIIRVDAEGSLEKVFEM